MLARKGDNVAIVTTLRGLVTSRQTGCLVALSGAHDGTTTKLMVLRARRWVVNWSFHDTKSHSNLTAWQLANVNRLFTVPCVG